MAIISPILAQKLPSVYYLLFTNKFNFYSLFANNENPNKMIILFDTSKKGYLNFKDFLLAISMTNAETPEDKLRLAFRMFDIDGNGELR